MTDPCNDTPVDMVEAHIATLRLEPAKIRYGDVVAGIDESALVAVAC
jgi:hypothetical protein